MKTICEFDMVIDNVNFSFYVKKEADEIFNYHLMCKGMEKIVKPLHVIIMIMLKK